VTLTGWIAVIALGGLVIAALVLWLAERRKKSATTEAARELGDSAVAAAKRAAEADAAKAAADAQAKVQAAQDAAAKEKHGSLADTLRRLGAGK